MALFKLQSRTLSQSIMKSCNHKCKMFSVIGTSHFHSGHPVGEKAKSIFIGNRYKLPAQDLKWAPPIWKHQWMLLMKRKLEVEGPEEPRRRSDQLNWNYVAELQAFAYRLHIQVHADILKRAFTEPIQQDAENEDSVMDVTDENNEKMAKIGKTFARDFFTLYVKSAFPKLGAGCASSVVKFLKSKGNISHLAGNLGFSDLIQSQRFPLTKASLCQAFFAVVTAIVHGPGGKIEAAKFLYDFVITSLNDKDIVHDIWKPKDPMKYLIRELKTHGLPPPEVRLTRQSGITSVMPVVFVGLFCREELLAESGGETVIKAENDAAKLALKNLYDVNINRVISRSDLLCDPNFVDRVNSLNIQEILQLENRGLDKQISSV